MNRTARRRARHHVQRPDDVDPADVHCRAGALARALVPLLAGCPDALSAERVVSDLAAAWTPEDAARVVTAIELSEPEGVACAALHALAWTLRCPEAAIAADRRADDGQLSPPWARQLDAWVPTGATSARHGGERLACVAFDGPQPHALAIGVFGGRRSRLGLLQPGMEMDDAEPIPARAAADLLALALGPSMTLCVGDGPDLRRLATRRLEVLRAVD